MRRVILTTIAAVLFIASSPREARAVTAIVAAVSTTLNLLGASVAFQAVAGQFLVTAFSALGGVILSTALALAASLFAERPQKPRPEDIEGYTKSPIPYRRLIFGQGLAGGAYSFSRVKENAIYFDLYHGESEAVTVLSHRFGDVLLTLNGSNEVTNPSHQHNSAPVFTIEQKVGTSGQAASSILVDAFSEYTIAHVGSGACHTTVKGNAIVLERRREVYNGHGGMGLGDPEYRLEAKFQRCYDPRQGGHDIDDPTSWDYSDNAALVIATFRIHRDGWNLPHSSVNWTEIATAANICDQVIAGAESQSVKRYRIWTHVNDDEKRIDAELRMLEACDGMRFFDDQGRWYIKVGAYETPTVSLGIIDVIQMDVNDNVQGENDFNGYIVQYTDERLDYKTTESAVWKHPEKYIEIGGRRSFAVIDAPEAPCHNQGVRLAKAIGTRSQARKRISLVANWRALRLRTHRFVSLDSSLAPDDGSYEIMGFEESQDGMHVALALIATDSGNWDLTAGEEGGLPTDSVLSSNALTLSEPPDFDVVAEAVVLSNGLGVQLVATWTALDEDFSRVEVEYRKKTTTPWLKMLVDDDNLRAITGPVNDGDVFEIRGRTRSLSTVSDWTATEEVTATADTVAPDPVTGVSATGQLGAVDLDWTNPNSPNFKAARIYRHTANNFGASTLITTINGAPSAAGSHTDTVVAGTYFYWIVSINGSNLEGTEVATGSVTAT